MPLTVPNLDDRRYQDLLNEALSRIPVYTPEWTNYNKSDPGVTLIEVFAFLTEAMLYRCNQVPERNRKKFLRLLNVPLQPATAAQGLVTISNDKGPLQTVTLSDGVAIRAGQVPFLSARGLDVLPIEARIYFKQAIPSPPQAVLDYYQQLYASFRGNPQQPPPQLYQVAAFPLPGGAPVQLSDTIDNYLWLALLVRDGDKPADLWADEAREAIAGKTLTIGVVPYLSDSSLTLPAGRSANAPAPVTLQFDIPSLGATAGLVDPNRVPQYRPLQSTVTTDVFTQPGVIDISLPGKSELYLWNNIDPLEAGVGLLPPAIDDSSVNDRLITWIRIRPSAQTQAQFLWMGGNCVPVKQAEHVNAELLPAGTGEPDQVVRLSLAPVLPDTVSITVTTAQGEVSTWTPVSDLFSAGPEVPVPDPRSAPGSAVPTPTKSKVFLLDAEAGQITFGDGAHGARPPYQAVMRADYDFSLGAAGNVGPGSLNTSPVLPQGLTVSNPVGTWGGADAETPAEGERQITRYLQHRDRLVTPYDFEVITLRTPGVEIGRVEVLPAFHPDLSSGRGGDAPGVVTVMVIPTYDPVTPDAPSPNSGFLDTVCSYLDTRRLITTEVVLRGPLYVGIWISVGIRTLPGQLNPGAVRDAVKAAVVAFLAPIVGGPQQLPDDPSVVLSAPQSIYKGWPLGKSVIALELVAVASRVPGVDFVQDILLAQVGAGASAQVDFSGLQLPRVLGISVTEGNPISVAELQGAQGATSGGGGGNAGGPAQIPVIPQECL
jgi:Baseplate J-like protein